MYTVSYTHLDVYKRQGHLRYGTYGGNSIEACHPFLRQNNWMSRNLVVAGNFNMTNVDELFQDLVEIGQHPKEKADTVTCLLYTSCQLNITLIGIRNETINFARCRINVV